MGGARETYPQIMKLMKMALLVLDRSTNLKNAELITLTS